MPTIDNPIITLFLLPVAFLAGGVGAILGLGGGIIMVPFLTLVLGVDIQAAIAASLVSIVATSSGAAAAYLRDQLTNYRLGIFLALATVVGAMTGFLFHRWIEPNLLFGFFGVFLIWSAWMMFRKGSEVVEKVGTHSSALAKDLGLNGEFKDDQGVMRKYEAENIGWGFLGMYAAGVLSALLGIGSGSLKVLVMDGLMKLPLKVSSATSNFMIGITAAASAGAFLLEGKIDMGIAPPVALGILLGSMAGARLMVKLPTKSIRRSFVIVLLFLGMQMLMRSVGAR